MRIDFILIQHEKQNARPGHTSAGRASGFADAPSIVSEVG